MKNTVGIFTKKLRKEKHITQEQLAKELNVSEKVVSRWETGSSIPDLEYSKLICNYFNITMDELISGKRLLKKRTKKILIGILVPLAIISILIVIIYPKNNQPKPICSKQREIYLFTSTNPDYHFNSYLIKEDNYNLFILHKIINNTNNANLKIDSISIEVYIDEKYIATASILDDTDTLDNLLLKSKLLITDTSSSFDKCFEEKCNLSIEVKYTQNEKEYHDSFLTEYRIYR